MSKEHDAEMFRLYGYRPSKARACPRSVLGLRCSAWRARGTQCPCQEFSRLLDHSRMWLNDDGRQVLTAEPYHADPDEWFRFVVVMREIGLAALAGGESPWCPPSTHLITVVRPVDVTSVTAMILAHYEKAQTHRPAPQGDHSRTDYLAMLAELEARGEYTRTRTEKRPMGTTVKFYKNGDSMAITTDAVEERDFIEAASAALAEMMDARLFDGDWDFQLGYWLPQIVDIVCKLRGYKSSVQEVRLIAAGHIPPDDADLVLGTDRRGSHVVGDSYAARMSSAEMDAALARAVTMPPPEAQNAEVEALVE